MLVVMVVGVFMAAAFGWVAFRKHSWIHALGALNSVSPVLYFLFWNLFFR